MASAMQTAKGTIGAAAHCLSWQKTPARKEFLEKLARCTFPITNDEVIPAFHANPSISVDASYINCTAVVNGQMCGCPIVVTTLDDTGEPKKVPGFSAFALTVCVRCLIDLHTTTKSPKSSDKGTKIADVDLALLALKDNAIPLDAPEMIKTIRARVCPKHSFTSVSQTIRLSHLRGASSLCSGSSGSPIRTPATALCESKPYSRLLSLMPTRPSLSCAPSLCANS